MKKKIFNIIGIVCFFAFMISFGAACFLMEPVDILVSERRKAAQFPEFSIESVMDKTFFDDLEEFITDQFPLRDAFRSIKANIQLRLLNQKDNNGVYTVDGHISELDSVLNEESVKNAADKLNSVYEKYLSTANAKVYYSVIPDKNYFLAEKNGYPAMDYEKMLDIYTSSVKNMEYIDIFDCLEADSYFKTDSHWKQEKLDAVIGRFSEKMGFTAKPVNTYSSETIPDFKGVYAPRLAMESLSDEIICLSSEATNKASVFNLETNKTTIGVYDRAKLSGNDKYDVFLSGAAALLTVENPLAESEKELVIFRDSFGSSLAPLMLEGYSKITLVDLRYISSQIIGEYVDFENSDILFIYNTQILNESTMLK